MQSRFGRALSSCLFARAYTMAPTLVPVSQPVVLCGPSGAGKSTLIKKLQDEFPGQYNFSVSHTTRSPRPGEVNGKAYHFVTKAEFENLINEKGFAEYTTTYDTYYGTSLRAIKEASTEGGSCLLDIDTVGVANIKKHHASLGCLFIFISPPSLSSLGDRLRKRGTENEDTIVKRLAKAKSEIEYAASGAFDVIVVNDNVDRSYALLRSVIRDGVRTGDSLPDGILEETAVSIN
ncbi:Guanylate kinase-like protein [Rhizoctonia solani]|uniref:Guanylate kinase n=2 Tax=Rhizoctonia solani TaxID=456999 RepID=A0A8H7HFC3_9AGAM|nr:Guanylate kinase-like protein [Rhizoctonia solani]